jgi:hypothetical protein
MQRLAFPVSALSTHSDLDFEIRSGQELFIFTLKTNN